MIVRELVAKFGIDFDDRGEKKATSALDGLKSLAAKVGLAVSASAIGAGLYKMVSMASTAADTLALLNTTFGASADAVLEWADANADALGRSRYALRDYATQLGVVVQGLTGSEKSAAEVGRNFAKLAVDMKAFFPNTTDLDALNALRSALTGETEPMKRFGVVMDDAALAAFALRQGNRTLWKDMDAGAKTMVRYQFIMSNANMRKAWGAAGREADSFSGRMERLTNKASDLGTSLGEKFLPMAIEVLKLLEKLTPAAGFVADAIGALASQTYFFEWVAGIAALYGGAKLLAMLVNLYRVIRTQTLLAVGRLITGVQALPAAFAAASAAVKGFLIAAAPIAATVATVLALGVAVYALYETFTTGTNFLAEWTEEAFGLQTALVTAIGAVHTWFKETWDKISTYATEALETIRAKIADVLPAGVLAVLAKVGVDLRGADRAASARTAAGATAAPGTTVASRSVNVTNGNITVNVNGSATPQAAQAVGREVQKALDQNNRNLAATAPGGA